MKTKKILFSLILLLICFVVVSIDKTNISQGSSLKQEARTVEYSKMEFGENVFDDFDSHDVVQNNDGINIKAEKTFDANLLEEFDLVGLDNNSNEFIVDYEINYIEKEDTVFLSATIVGDNDISIIDTIPGLVSINNAGQPGILFSVDDELIWLSDLTDSNVIDNSGWFKNLIKKVTNTAVDVASKGVKALEPIIRPAVNMSTYLAVKLLGPNMASYLGATILNMKSDTNGIYYADFNCWQQYFGYTDFYDTVFDASTSMRFGKFEFDVNNDGYSDYVLWAWKGNYLNLGAGAELGIYKRWAYSDKIWKVDKNNAMKMTLKLEHKTKGTLFDRRPADKQWWITGFDYKTPNVNRDDLKATYSVEFTNANWYECFKNRWKQRDSRWNFGTYKKPVLTLDWI